MALKNPGKIVTKERATARGSATFHLIKMRNLILRIKSLGMQISSNAIRPKDSRYNEWNDRGVNDLFKGRPDFIIPVNTIDELKEALQNTVEQNHYVAVRGGGHCLEDFVANPEVKVIIDISRIKGVRFDDHYNCFEVMAGETASFTSMALNPFY